ncbi:MAG: class I SAM-dependent methyltransferase [candidate division WOR-3 bacterium]
MPKTYSEIENWILAEVNPVLSNSVDQTYERLVRIRERMPVIDVPQDLNREEDFREEAVVRELALYFQGCERVLDVGCGDGWPVLRLATHLPQVTGIDASTRRIAVATENARRMGLKNVTLKQMSATELGFEDNTFDGVVAVNVVEQTPEPYQVLREIYRVLKPGGRLKIYFEAGNNTEKGTTERVFLTETDISLGYHYVLRHHRPPWERNYLIEFTPTPEMKEEFRRLQELIDRLGPVPAQVPELGLEFLTRNRSGIKGGTWYEIEHFTSETMRDTVEEVGFTDVRIVYSAGTLARRFQPQIAEQGLSPVQLQAVCQGLAVVSAEINAPSAADEPVVAVKPERG